MTENFKQFVGAIALLRRERGENRGRGEGRGGASEWLTQWNAGRGCYHFIEAHKLDDESFRDSLVREVAWATGLAKGKDFLVSSAPRAHLTFAETPSCQAEPTWFVVEFYLVELMGRRHREILNADDRFGWVSHADITAGAAADGRPLCPRLLSLLRQADIMAPWQAE